MKFTKIRVTGLTAIEFPIVGALPSDVYILKSVDGLGPPAVDVSIAETLNAGGFYQGRRPQNREVVLTIGLNPNYASGQSAADLRTSLYGFLTPGSDDRVTVDVMDDTTVVATTFGYVSKLEISPFSKDPQVQVTIPCTQPYLQAHDTLYLDPGDKASPQINNVGTAPSGFHMELTLTAAMNSWTLTDVTGKNISFAYPFLTGDKIVFDTRPGLRSVNLVRNSVSSSILASLTSDSIWLTLYGGLNTLTTSSQAFNWGDVYYVPQYWGI